MKPWARIASILALLLTWTPPALADTRSVSYSTWRVSAEIVTLRYLLPAEEARGLIGAALPVLSSAKLGEYLLDHVSVSAAGRACPAIDQGYDIGLVDPLAVGEGFYGFEIFFRCDSTRDLVLTDRAVFERSPSHITFARIEWAGRRSEAFFRSDQPQLRLAAPDRLPSAGLTGYLRLGAEHILQSPDRLCWLLALLVLLRRKRDAPYAFLGLGCGYGIALLVSASAGLIPQQNLLEASFGLMLGLLAFAIVLPQIDRPGLAIAVWPGLLALLAVIAAARHASAPAWLLAGMALLSLAFLTDVAAGRAPVLNYLLPPVLFGFLDGFVLPSVQAVMQLPSSVQLPMLIGFDLGAWFTAALLMLLASTAFLALQRWMPLKRQLAAARPLNQAVAAGLGALGSFWLLTRIHL